MDRMRQKYALEQKEPSVTEYLNLRKLADKLYGKFGFTYTEPVSSGMYKKY